MSYNYLENLDNVDLKNKSVLIIGAGYIANEYALSLSSMGIKNVTILSKSKKNS